MDSSSEQLSTVSGPQQKVQGLVGNAFGNLLGPGFAGLSSQALMDLLGGIPQDMSELTEGAFRDFNNFAVPSINAQASGLSATQSTRRVGEIARAAGSVTSQLAGIRAQFADSARNRQSSTLLGILNSASGFANAGGTVENLVEGSPFGQIMGLAGTLGGAFLGGPLGALAGGALFGGAAGGGGGGDK